MKDTTIYMNFIHTCTSTITCRPEGSTSDKVRLVVTIKYSKQVSLKMQVTMEWEIRQLLGDSLQVGSNNVNVIAYLMVSQEGDKIIVKGK